MTMGHFTDGEIEKMSQNQVYILICQGLSEVCSMMEQDPKYAGMNSRDLKRMANEFGNLSKVFAKLAVREGSLVNKGKQE